MEILIIDGDESLRGMAAFALESQLGAHVLQAKNCGDGLKTAKKAKRLQAIISEYSLPDQSGGTLYRMLQEDPKLSSIPFFLIADREVETLADLKSAKLTGSMVKPFQLNALVKLVRDNIVKESKSDFSSAYCGIPIPILLQFKEVLADVYIKLSDGKYVRLLNKGDPFEKIDEAKFKEKKVNLLYIKKEDTDTFLSEFAGGAKEALRLSVGTDESFFEVPKKVHQLIHHAIHTVGFTEEVRVLTEETVNHSVETILDNPKLSVWLEKILPIREDYISAHSLVLAYLACGISSLIGWVSKETFYKLTLAAMLHDIAILDDDLAKFQTRNDLDKVIGIRSPANIHLFLSHPENAAKIVKSAGGFPADVDLIILQHHERVDGSGFPRGLKEKDIHPLALVLIIAHELTSYMVEKGTQWTLSGFLEKVSPHYTAGLGRKIIDELVIASAAPDQL